MPNEDSGPIWSPDGRHLAYTSTRFGGQAVPATKPAETLDRGTLIVESFRRGATFVDAWATGETLLLTHAEQEAGRRRTRLLAMPAAGGHPRPFASSRYDRFGAAAAPPGGRLAFVSLETGRPEVFAASLPHAADPRQASLGGGTSPVWARDGRRLFYRNGDALLAVNVAAGGGLGLSAPRVLFAAGMRNRQGPTGRATTTSRRTAGF